MQKKLSKKDDEETSDDAEEEVEQKTEKRKKKRKRSVPNYMKTLEHNGSETEDDDEDVESISITEDDEMKIRNLVESDETIMNESVTFKLME